MSGYEDWIERTGGCTFPVKIGPEEEPGLTKRDWFAGQALQGQPAPTVAMMGEQGYRESLEELAQHCHAIADAMLKAGSE